jgi:hypothetical protein
LFCRKSRTNSKFLCRSGLLLKSLWIWIYNILGCGLGRLTCCGSLPTVQKNCCGMVRWDEMSGPARQLSSQKEQYFTYRHVWYDIFLIWEMLTSNQIFVVCDTFGPATSGNSADGGKVLYHPIAGFLMGGMKGRCHLLTSLPILSTSW